MSFISDCPGNREKILLVAQLYGRASRFWETAFSPGHGHEVTAPDPHWEGPCQREGKAGLSCCPPPASGTEVLSQEREVVQPAG